MLARMLVSKQIGLLKQINYHLDCMVSNLFCVWEISNFKISKWTSIQYNVFEHLF